MGSQLTAAGVVTDIGIKHQFVCGLNISIRTYVIPRMEKDNLASLIDDALAYEQAINADKEARPRRTVSTFPRTNTAPTAGSWRSATSATRATSTAPVGPGMLSDDKRERRMATGECFACGERGHIRRDYPLERRVKQEVNLIDV